MASPGDPDPLDALLFACVTLLVYDYMLTFQLEVELVWKRQWGLGTVLFVFNRYSPFIESIISLSIRFFFLSPQMCEKLTAILTWFIVLGLLTSEFILMLRTYAIWDRSRRALYILFSTGTLLSVLGIVSTEMELRSIKWEHAPGGKGCHISEAGTIIFPAYISLLICETTIAVMTAMKASSHLRRSHSDFVVVLYRDGFLFYLYCIGISLLNIVLTATGPAGELACNAAAYHPLYLLFSCVVLYIQVKTWDLQSSKPPVPTSSNYFTSILPPPATGHDEEIQMKEMGQVNRGGGLEDVYSSHDIVRWGAVD